MYTASGIMRVSVVFPTRRTPESPDDGPAEIRRLETVQPRYHA